MTRANRRAPLWRTALSWLFLFLFCLAAPLALATGWARLVVSDPDAYAQSVRRVAGDSRVQAGLVRAVTARTEQALAGENPTATEAVQSRVVAQALGGAVGDVVASEEFAQVWEAANRQAYAILASDLNADWGQPVALDFSPLADELQAEIDALDLELPEELSVDPEDLHIEVLDAGNADQVRRAIQNLNAAFWGSLAVALVALLLSVAFAPDRLAALGRAAFGLGIAMIVLIAAMLVGQRWAATRVMTSGAGSTLEAVLEAISQNLRFSAVVLAVGGLILAGIFSGLCALRRSAARLP
jgi:hypothetical protein